MAKTLNKKSFFHLLIILLLFVVTSNVLAASPSSSSVVTLITDVQPVISLSLSSHTYSFGNLYSGVPRKGSGGISVGVMTVSANGYGLSVSDGTADGYSSMTLESDGVTKIIDFIEDINSPQYWNVGASKGVGITVFGASTNKEAKWGEGTVFDDSLNKYAGVPEFATEIHSSPGYKPDVDYTNVAFVVDVDAGQPSGTYSGDVLFTATASL